MCIRDRSNELTSSALQILRTGRRDVIDDFREALKARLSADLPKTMRGWARLLDKAHELQPVRMEYLRALEGYDREVYYFSPSVRPFRPSRAQRAAYLEKFLAVAGAYPEADRARLDLFLLSVQLRDFKRARDLLAESLAQGGPNAIEGIPEAFEDFIEKPETQPWLEAAMDGVFLDPGLRPKIEAQLTDPEPALLIRMAAVKLALMRGDLDRARLESDSGAAIYGNVVDDQRSPRLRQFYAQLVAFRAREAALRGLFGEAATSFEKAATHLIESGTVELEAVFEYEFQAALYQDRLRAEDRNYLKSRVASEAVHGDGKLRLVDESQAALDDLVNQPDCPPFLRRKAMIELAALEEYMGDPYQAARRWADVASAGNISPLKVNWLAYRIARAHLQINHRTQEARAALRAVRESLPGTPLAYLADDLLQSAGAD
jgi:hypothetical protein